LVLSFGFNAAKWILEYIKKEAISGPQLTDFFRGILYVIVRSRNNHFEKAKLCFFSYN